MLPGALGPPGGRLNKKRGGVGGEGGGNYREWTGREQHSLQLVGTKKLNRSKKKGKVNQNVQIVPHLQDNVNSNTLGKRLIETETGPTEEASNLSERLIRG